VDHGEQQKRLVGVAKAFFARGIPNFIGTGWEVDDRCALEVARWFYAGILGLGRPDGTTAIMSPPAAIGEALLAARREAFACKVQSSTWGAYQHYGRLSERILSLGDRTTTSSGDEPSRVSAQTSSPSPSVGQASAAAPAQSSDILNPSVSRVTKMSTNG